MTDTPPPPSSALDDDLARFVHRSRLVLPVAIVFLALTIAVLVGAVIYLGVVAAGERSRTNAVVRHTTDNMCGFFGSLGTAPLPPTSTQFGAALVIDSRNIYVNLSCDPKLAPPDPVLVDLAAKYHLKLAR